MPNDAFVLIFEHRISQRRILAVKGKAHPSSKLCGALKNRPHFCAAKQASNSGCPIGSHISDLHGPRGVYRDSVTIELVIRFKN